MKKLLILTLLAASSVFADTGNTVITNTSDRPVPVTIITKSGTTVTVDRPPTAYHLTANGTTTVTSTTAYIKAIQITCTTAGTTETITIRDKGGTPKTLYQSGTLVVGSVFTYQGAPLLMTGGIDIIYAGTTAGVVDVFLTYSQ